MSKLTFKKEIVHTEKYTDKQTGEEKKKYTKVGALFEYSDGGQCIKIFDTWFNLYEPRVNEQGYQQARKSISDDANGIIDADRQDMAPF